MAKKRVLAFGTFDLIHEGHIHFLKKAKKHGDELIVVVARDETVEQVKGKKPLYDENRRKEQVKYLGIADKVFLGNRVDRYGVVRRHNPDVIALGYDQRHFTDGLEKIVKKMEKKPKIVRITAYKPERFKSSLLKKRL